MKTKNSEFLAKGAYGCVFYPSIDACSGKTETNIDSDHYITKIQMYAPNADDEIIIGQQLQKLHLYDHYFAPVIKSCKLKISKMDYNLVKTCATLQNELGELNSTSAYVSNKIRYVGKQNIGKYIQSLKSDPQKLYKKLINTHLHILDAIKLLGSENIIHFDIKPQNVLYDEIQNIPIIIDFGLSRSITPLISPNMNAIMNISQHTNPYKSLETEKLTNKQAKEFEKIMRHTFVSYDTYDYWCIDIYILSNIGTTTSLKPNQEVTVEQMKQLLRGFMTPNFLTILTGEEVYQFKRRVLDYFMQFIKKQYTWMDVFKVLIQNYTKWDNYSAAMTYLYCFIRARPSASDAMKTYKREPAEIQQYLSLLKIIVLAMPNERPGPVETQIAIREIFRFTERNNETNQTAINAKPEKNDKYNDMNTSDDENEQLFAS